MVQRTSARRTCTGVSGAWLCTCSGWNKYLLTAHAPHALSHLASAQQLELRELIKFVHGFTGPMEAQHSSTQKDENRLKSMHALCWWSRYATATLQASLGGFSVYGLCVQCTVHIR